MNDHLIKLKKYQSVLEAEYQILADSYKRIRAVSVGTDFLVLNFGISSIKSKIKELEPLTGIEASI